MRLGPVVLEAHGRRESGLRDLDQILEDLEILEVDPDGRYIVATQKLSHPTTVDREAPPIGEIGSLGTRWRRELGAQEYNPELRGLTGLRNFDRMRRSDASVSAALKIAKTPVLEAEWWVDSADPEDDLANRQAEFVSKALFDWQAIGWTQWMTEALTMLDFGYSFFEKVFTKHSWKGSSRVIWKELAPRGVEDVVEWEFDRKGRPLWAEMEGFEGNTGVFLPIDRLLVFSYRKESGNIEGRSALREMYKHWYYLENLYKIDAIQKERHGIGIPIIKLPPNFSPTDKKLADELGRNLRTNEWAHIVLPPMWELEFAEVRGASVDVLSSISHHSTMITHSVLGSFVESEEEGDAATQLDLFMKSTRYLADLIREVFNKDAIPELINYNWTGTNDFPILKVRHIGQVADLKTISFTVRNLIGAKAIIPDDKLEEYLRNLNDLPRRDSSTSREVATPQLAGSGGPGTQPSRQSQAGKQRLQPGASAGTDRSGG